MLDSITKRCAAVLINTVLQHGERWRRKSEAVSTASFVGYQLSTLNHQPL